jgi:hypothetical protein
LIFPEKPFSLCNSPDIISTSEILMRFGNFPKLCKILDN